MNSESRKNLAAAFDALEAIIMGRQHKAKHPKGGGYSCDYCGGYPGGPEHGGVHWEPKPVTCPIQLALGHLTVLMPSWPEREAWISAGDAPTHPDAGKGEP